MKYDIAFIGAGNMGGILLERVCRGHDPRRVAFTRRDGEKGAAQAEKLGCVFCPHGADAAGEARFVVLCVKPQNLLEVLDTLRPAMRDAAAAGTKQVLASIAAGVTLEALEAALADGGPDVPVIRLMPNTPCAVGRGIVFMTPGGRASEADCGELAELLGECGAVERVSEGHLDMGGTLAGCGPAFAYLFLEALADGGVEIGLPRALAQQWAARMVSGAAEMVLETGRHPGALKDEVCSPGGSTIAGVAALERMAFRSAAAQAVTASYEKSKRLG